MHGHGVDEKFCPYFLGCAQLLYDDSKKAPDGFFLTSNMQKNPFLARGVPWTPLGTLQCYNACPSPLVTQAVTPHTCRRRVLSWGVIFTLNLLVGSECREENKGPLLSSIRSNLVLIRPCV